MREMLSPTSALMAKDWARCGADYGWKIFGGSHGFVVGISLRSVFVGGPIAIIRMATQSQSMPSSVKSHWMSLAKKIKSRLAKWDRKTSYARGVLAKYAKLVSSATWAQVTDSGL